MAVLSVYCSLAQIGLIAYILTTWHDVEEKKLDGVTDPYHITHIKDSLKVCLALYIGIIAFAACSVIASLMLIGGIWKRVPEVVVIFILVELFVEVGAFILQIILLIKDTYHYASLVLTLVNRLFDVYYIVVAFSYYLKIVNEQFYSLESVHSAVGKHSIKSPEDPPKQVTIESKPVVDE